MQSWLARVVAHPRALGLALLLGVGLSWPALFNGHVLDDRLHTVTVRGELPWLTRDATELYRFFPDEPAAAATMRAIGASPWYAAPDMHVAFARPLASALRFAELRAIDAGLPIVFGALHHLVWYALLVWAVHALALTLGRAAAVSRPRRVANLSALVFACFEGHGVLLGWTANRHATMSLALATRALVAHVRWRFAGWRWGAPAAAARAARRVDGGRAWHPAAGQARRLRVGFPVPRPSGRLAAQPALAHGLAGDARRYGRGRRHQPRPAERVVGHERRWPGTNRDAVARWIARSFRYSVFGFTP